MKAPSPWRTIVAVLALALLTAGELAVCVLVGKSDVAARCFETAAWANVGLAGFLSAKATIQHAATGSGIKGAIAAIMTAVKPGDPAPEPEPKVSP